MQIINEGKLYSYESQEEMNKHKEIMISEGWKINNTFISIKNNVFSRSFKKGNFDFIKEILKDAYPVK
jgi:hypothetical protein